MSDYDITFWSSRPDSESFWHPYENRADNHNTSKALLEALHQLAMPINARCHEMGANLGRNLNYIQGDYPLWRLSANDVNPRAPGKMRRTYPDLSVEYSIESSQDWVSRTEPVDVILSVSHFIHVEDMAPFVEWLPRKVKGYLILREGAGLHEPNTEYYNYWTIARQRDGKSRWFDRDYEKVFAGTSLQLVDRHEQYTFSDAVLGQPTRRQYDIYVFKQTGEVGE
jgi:hypothetical protein